MIYPLFNLSHFDTESDIGKPSGAAAR